MTPERTTARHDSKARGLTAWSLKIVLLLAMVSAGGRAFAVDDIDLDGPVVRPIGESDESAEPAMADDPSDEAMADDAASDPDDNDPKEVVEDEPVPTWHVLARPPMYIEYYKGKKPASLGKAIGETVKLAGFSPEYLFIERGNVEDLVEWSSLQGAIDGDGAWRVDLREYSTDQEDFEHFTKNVRTPKISRKYGFQSHETVLRLRREQGLDPPLAPAAEEVVAAAPPAPPRVPSIPEPAEEAPAAAPAPAVAPAAAMDWKMIAIIGAAVLFILFLIAR